VGCEGTRAGGTGEHVVYIRPPPLEDGRVPAVATLEVWSRSLDRQGRAAGDRPWSWKLARSLTVEYGKALGEGGRPHAND
jgi:hypothetical protein